MPLYFLPMLCQHMALASMMSMWQQPFHVPQPVASSSTGD